MARGSGNDSHEHDARDDAAHEHGHPHDHAHGGIRGFVASILSPSHDPADSIDEALTADARGIRALKISLVVLGVTAFAQLGIVFISGSVALLADVSRWHVIVGLAGWNVLVFLPRAAASQS